MTPRSGSVDPSGKFAYVANGDSNDVSIYTINAATGVLTPTGTIGARPGAMSVSVDPSGKFAYVANASDNSVSMYTINTTTGALTSLGPIAAGSLPFSVVTTGM
jgi:YVTN family beta-propeller protein